MYCERCQIEYPEGKKFCRQCGEPLKPRAPAHLREATLCPNCGAQILPRAKFCGSCGTSLVGQVISPSEPVQPSVLGRAGQVNEALLEEQVRQQRRKVLKGVVTGIGSVGLLTVVIFGGLFAYRTYMPPPPPIPEEVSKKQAAQNTRETPSPSEGKVKQEPERKAPQEDVAVQHNSGLGADKQEPERKVPQEGGERETALPTKTWVETDASSVAEELKRVVPRAAPSEEDFCHGDFHVESVKDSTGQERVMVSFWITGREVFKVAVRTFDQESFSTHELAVIHFQGCTGLLRRTLSGPSGGNINSELIVPYQRTFKTFQLEDWSGPDDIKDLDGDRIDELLVQKLVLGYECVAGAYRQYWTTIYHYDPVQGRLVEVSDQFPQFYVTRAKDYQKALQEIKHSGPLSSQCRAKMQGLIAKAQQYTAASNTTPTATTSTAAPSLSPGWYEVFRSTPVLEEPHRDAAVITRLPSKKRVYVVSVTGDYARVESTRGKPPGYIARKDLVPAREGKEAAKLEEQQRREEEQQQRLQAQEEARRQAEAARQMEIQRREEERRQREEWQQQQELLRSGERILRDLGR